MREKTPSTVEEIRHRSQGNNCQCEACDDRRVLLAEIDRLTAELQQRRSA